MQATGEVTKAVSAILDGVHANSQATEKAVTLSTESATLAKESGQRLARILGMTRQVAEDTQAITQNTKEQTAASEQILEVMENITEQSHQTSNNMNESANHVVELSTLAGELKTIIDAMRSERRSNARHTIPIPFVVTVQLDSGAQVSARLMDICQSGARLSVEGAKLKTTDMIRVNAKEPMHEVFADRAARVMWTEGSYAGVFFNHPVMTNLTALVQKLALTR